MVSLFEILKIVSYSIIFISLIKLKINLFNALNKRRTMSFFNIPWNQCPRLSILSWGVKPRTAPNKLILPGAVWIAVGVPEDKFERPWVH
jgi:hypothetical protein